MAAIAELTPAERSAWLMAAASCHFVWGLQPVLSRWLQTRGGVDTMSLAFMALFASFAANVLSSLNSPPPPKALPMDDNDAPAAGGSAGGGWTAAHKRLGAMVAVAYALRSSTNFMSASFTQAYTVAMIQMLGVHRAGRPCCCRRWRAVVAPMRWHSCATTGVAQPPLPHHWRAQCTCTAAAALVG